MKDRWKHAACGLKDTEGNTCIVPLNPDGSPHDGKHYKANPRRLPHTWCSLRRGKEVPAKLFMCLRHWRMVPRDLQRAIWAAYRPGQEVDKQASAEYLEISQRAIRAVAEKEV